MERLKKWLEERRIAWIQTWCSHVYRKAGDPKTLTTEFTNQVSGESYYYIFEYQEVVCIKCSHEDIQGLRAGYQK